MRSLPLITLYLTERCNSRCVSCDYWRHGRADVTAAAIAGLLPELERLGTKLVLISGGEPLVHPQWAEIAATLRAGGLELWLLTSGLSLLKHAARAAALFPSITVSLDGIDRPMYAAIRGLDAFDHVCGGIRAATDSGAHVGVRVTVQRRNYRHLATFVELAHRCGASEISFLAADVSNRQAFGRSEADDGTPSSQLSLLPQDLPLFAEALESLERDHARDFESGFIAESPSKMRRLWQYFAALCGLARFPPTRCNAPAFSAVLEAGGRVNPCFFIQGPPARAPLGQALDAPAMRQLREDIRGGRRAECLTCVCSMWREPEALSRLSATAVSAALRRHGPPGNARDGARYAG
jgi:MoaA/NifB/PqqE/SkfB family radical SAM enzyme